MNNEQTNQLTKKSFYIKGMHCASCVYSNEKALKSVSGVMDANVNLTTSKATISYKNPVDDQKLIDAVASVGYQALIENDKDSLDDKIKKEKLKELKDLRLKVTVSLVLGAIIVWGSFPGLMEFAPEPIKNFYIQMALASVVQFWAAKELYKAAGSSLKNRLANMDTLVVIGTTVAFVYSVFVTFMPDFFMEFGIEAMPYFDVSTVIIGLILLGRYFEAQAKAGTGEAIKKLIGLQAKEAIVLVKENDERIKA